MQNEPTVCATCYHMWMVNKTDPWWRWVCRKFPREQVFNPVTGLTVADPPCLECKIINRGECKYWEAGPNDLQPRKMPS